MKTAFAVAPLCWWADKALYYGDSCRRQLAVHNHSREGQFRWNSVELHRFLVLAWWAGEHREDLETPWGPPSTPLHQDVTRREKEGWNPFASKQHKLVKCEACGCTELPCHVGFRKTSLTALCKVAWASSDRGKHWHWGRPVPLHYFLSLQFSFCKFVLFLEGMCLY